MRVLVIGKTGQLARALNTVNTVVGEAAQIGFLGRERLDLMIPGMAARAIAAERPELVINAAAYTAVDDAEDACDALLEEAADACDDELDALEDAADSGDSGGESNDDSDDEGEED